MLDYSELNPPDFYEDEKECYECGKAHNNKGSYCSSLCANASML